MPRILTTIFALFLLSFTAAADEGGWTTVLDLPPGKGNQRNSEGSFVRLRDGRLLFVYTHYTGGDGDHAAAHLAGRLSTDGGKSWTEKDTVVLPNEGKCNVMSSSLLRLRDGRIALFYMKKDSLKDCRPMMRISTDETATWSSPTTIIPDAARGYYVLNNDRVVQLESGRLIVPVARHNAPEWKKWTPYGIVMCYLSDDGGTTWRRSASTLDGRPEKGTQVMVQEPGVVALKDERLMMFCRTESGCQYVSYSKDGGDNWSRLQPSKIVSPRSPASIERIPATGHLLLVWNDHDGIPANLKGKRTPLTAAVSRDGAASWEGITTLENSPHGWFCYTAIEFVDDHVLLAYAAGDRRRNNGLARTKMIRVPLKRLLRKGRR